jgi:hypothetical protein
MQKSQVLCRVQASLFFSILYPLLSDSSNSAYIQTGKTGFGEILVGDHGENEYREIILCFCLAKISHRCLTSPVQFHFRCNVANEPEIK